MTNIQLISHNPANGPRPAAWQSVLTHTHTYSGRDDHGGTVKPPESYERLTNWTRRLGIDALGMGSAYSPATAKQYDRFDGDGRVEYYGGEFDQLSVRGDAEIAAMLEEVNNLSDGSTLFYLDNETPKGRFGHLWWVNYALDYPAWHDFDQDFDRWMVHQSRDDSDEPMPYVRRPYREIIASQRAQGALANWAHPTSWWLGGHGQFITNIASEMPAHLIADGYLDGLVVMGYHAFRPEYQNLWFALLDQGYRIPGVAEMDAGLSDVKLWEKPEAYLTLVHAPEKLRSASQIARAWQTGRLIAASGAWIEIQVDGVHMGSVAPTADSAAHQITINFGGNHALYDVELIGRGGQIVWQGAAMQPGNIQLTVPGSDERGYYIARVFALKADGNTRDTERCAVSNPVYLHPQGEKFEAPATTSLTLEFSPLSRWHGGEVRIETAGGESLYSAGIKGSTLEETAPAGGRITLVDTDGQQETYYIINTNQTLMDVQRYLYRGRFLRDYPALRSGEVPPEVWRFEDFKTAMHSCTLNF